MDLLPEEKELPEEERPPEARELPEEPVQEEAAAPGEAEAPAPQEERAAEPAAEQDELEDLRGLLLRVKADFSNYQKRVERDFGAMRRAAAGDVLLRILDLLDVVERTEREADKYSDFASLREAVTITAKEAEKFIRDSGLKRIPTLGQPFDPAIHEALMVSETQDQPEDHVVEEVRPGYMFDARVLRHAQVVVAKRPKEKE